jgi:hypothetical protein
VVAECEAIRKATGGVFIRNEVLKKDGKDAWNEKSAGTRKRDGKTGLAGTQEGKGDMKQCNAVCDLACRLLGYWLLLFSVSEFGTQSAVEGKCAFPVAASQLGRLMARSVFSWTRRALECGCVYSSTEVSRRGLEVGSGWSFGC